MGFRTLLGLKKAKAEKASIKKAPVHKAPATKASPVLPSQRFDIDGRSFSLDVPEPASDVRSVFVFSLRKAGSVLLNRMLTDLSEAAGIPSLNIPGSLWRQGIDSSADLLPAIGPLLQRDGYVFLGFRSVSPLIPPDALAGRRKVLLIRDPRDMLTSMYFSARYSHPVPPVGETRALLLASRARAEQATIDDFVLSEDAERSAEDYRGYIAAASDADWRIYRYEDVVFAKVEWLSDMSRHLGMAVGQENIEAIAKRHDILPEEERPETHIRQVRPGNHRKHLRPDTIERLNQRMADILSHFGYGPEQQPAAPVFTPAKPGS